MHLSLKVRENSVPAARTFNISSPWNHNDSGSILSGESTTGTSKNLNHLNVQTKLGGLGSGGDHVLHAFTYRNPGSTLSDAGEG